MSNYKLKLRGKIKAERVCTNTLPPIVFDCSCEIWMTVIKYKIPLLYFDVLLNDLEKGLKLIYADVANMCCRYLLSYSKFVEKYVFDNNEYTNPHKKTRNTDYYMRRFELSYTFDKENCLKYLKDLIRNDIRTISRLVFDKLKTKCLCIQTGPEYSYDADIYCGNNYKATFTHDLDILLFGSDIIVKDMSETCAIIVTIDEMIRKANVTSRKELKEFCLRVGSDYKND